MADEDPFAEPEDSDRTVIRPNPGGRRTAPQVPQQPAAAPFAPPQAQVQPESSAFGVAHSAGSQASTPNDLGIDAGMTGMNPLNAAASALFSLVSRIRNRAQHSDVPKLRDSVVQEIRNFENRALQAGIDAQDVKIARYAISATLDDVVLNTPWGEQSIWAQQSMVTVFHREVVGGDRFFDLLARLEKEPARNINLLEFLFMCLSLGFEGRLRVEEGGRDKHREIRSGLAKIIRVQREEVPEDLSPRWPGVHKPHRNLSAWTPVWIAASVALLAMVAGFGSFSWILSNSSERILGQMSLLDLGQVAQLERPAPPPEPLPLIPIPEVDVIKGFLEEEIRDGIVSVFQDGNAITIRIAGSGMFGSGSDRLAQKFVVPLDRVAKALNDQKGNVIIVGHSDNVPIRSSRFGSNKGLSLARAKTVMNMVAPKLDNPGRLSAEGRADKSPIASNDTAQGRAKNRRIEVVLIKENDA